MTTGLTLRSQGQDAVKAAERWLPVVGYEGCYEVSDQGRVRSLDRAVTDALWGGRTRRIKGQILAQHRGVGPQQNYLRVRLSRNNVRPTHWVHRLVALAFLGPRPDGMEICHNDGDGTNNCLDNLRYDTASANVLDQVKHGVHHHARKTSCDAGHPFDAGNTYVRPDGYRDCRACKYERDRQHVHRVANRTPTSHGLNGYQRYRCRCAVCRAANAASQRSKRQRRRRPA